MRLIILLLSRKSRRWLCATAIAFAWLGLCQPAAAAISCSASMQGVLIIYNGSAISDAQIPMRYGCSGLTPGGAYNFLGLCTTADAATSTGSGGTSVTPYRKAKSVAGNTLNFQLVQSGSVDLTASGIRFLSVGLTNTYSGTYGTNYAMAVDVPASQSVPAGDYVSTVPLTIDFRNKQTNIVSNCTDGTSANTTLLNIPITIRVGGAACEINVVPNLTLGSISVSSGTVAKLVSSGTQYFWITCASGTAWTATFSNGNNSLGTGNDRRRMVNGGSYLNYQLSTTSSGGTYLVDSTGITGTGTGMSQSIGPYVTIPAQTPASLTSGLYTDTVIMSLSY